MSLKSKPEAPPTETTSEADAFDVEDPVGLVRPTSASSELEERAARGILDAPGLSDVSNVRFIVDLDAVAHNYETMQSHCGSSECIPVVKADAYGLGMVAVAKRLAHEGADLFFVAQLQEAILMRQALPGVQVAVLDGVMEGTQEYFCEYQLIPVLNSFDQLQKWADYDPPQPLTKPTAMLHFDTGMHRLGLCRKDQQKLFENLDLLNQVDIHSYHSHFACAGIPNHEMTDVQLDRFNTILERLPKRPAAISNSNGVFLGEKAQFNMSRCGRALYGVKPSLTSKHGIRPTVHLQAKILQVRDVVKGDSTGYASTYTFARDSRIATVGIGYADALLVSLSNTGHCYVGGYRAPIIGRISMDLMTIDIRDIPPDLVEPGSFVEVIGEHQTVGDIARQGNTISYEILTRLSKRHKQRYIGAV